MKCLEDTVFVSGLQYSLFSAVAREEEKQNKTWIIHQLYSLIITRKGKSLITPGFLFCLLQVTLAVSAVCK